MSPDTYRTLIKPRHKRLNDAAKNLGMIPVQLLACFARLRRKSQGKNIAIIETVNKLRFAGK
jgi:hypothetical protein